MAKKSKSKTKTKTKAKDVDNNYSSLVDHEPLAPTDYDIQDELSLMGTYL